MVWKRIGLLESLNLDPYSISLLLTVSSTYSRFGAGECNFPHNEVFYETLACALRAYLDSENYTVVIGSLRMTCSI